MTFSAGASSMEVLPQNLSREPPRHRMTHATRTRQVFVSAATRRRPIGQGRRDFLHYLLTLFRQSTSVFRSHLHPLRNAFLVGLHGFWDRARRRQFCGQPRPENLLPTARAQARYAWPARTHLAALFAI